MMTTNDMPIIEPPHFDALGLVPFQINPHYLDANPEGHAGETREQRILEFLEVNPGIHVLGLREGTMLSVDGSSMALIGGKPMRVFKKGVEPNEHAPGDASDYLAG
jgi:dipeptidase E